MNEMLYYVTTDETNASSALGLASAAGIHLEPAEPRDLPLLEREAARVVLDWDYLPADLRARLLNGTACRLAGVHGYQVGDSVGGFLAVRGIVVSRHLDEAFVAALADSASAA